MLGEERGTQPLPYDKQPYFPNAAASPAADDAARTSSTSTSGSARSPRSRTPSWSRRRSASTPPRGCRPSGRCGCSRCRRDTTCDTPARRVGRADRALSRPPDDGGRRRPADDDPCIVPPTGGYRGIENRLYRVEVHDAGPLGTATFKWSRDNASIAFPVTGIDTARTKLTVTRVGRDAVPLLDRRLGRGDRRLARAERPARRAAQGHGRRRRRRDDHPRRPRCPPAPSTRSTPRGTRASAAGTRAARRSTPRTASWTCPPPPATDRPRGRRPGHVRRRPAPGDFHSGDYWVFAARTADASVEQLTAAPPRGIHHHFCRLAVVTFPSTVIDCRTLWPPDSARRGHDCECAVCVTPESHASGAAHDPDGRRPGQGHRRQGLPPARLLLPRPAGADHGRQSLALEGKGWRTILVSAGREPAIVVEGSLGVTIDSLTVLTSSFSRPGAPPAGIAIELRNTIGTRSSDACSSSSPPSRGGGDTGDDHQPAQAGFGAGPRAAGAPLIALDGLVVETLIQENVLVGTTGIGAVWGALYSGRRALRAWTPASTSGPRLARRPRPPAAPATCSRSISSSRRTCSSASSTASRWRASPSTSATRESSELNAGRPARRDRLQRPHVTGEEPHRRRRQHAPSVRLRDRGRDDDTRVVDNDVHGLLPRRGGGRGAPPRRRPDAIVLVPSIRPSGIDRCQVRATGSAILGNAIAVRTEVVSAQISHNTIQAIGGDGITMEEGSSAQTLTVEGNQILDVGGFERSGDLSAGILLQNDTDVSAIGNTVHGVVGVIPAGIVGHNCRRLRIVDNDMKGIIIGGAEIYKLGLPHATRLYLTEIDAEIAGDTFFPVFDKSRWNEVSRVHHDKDERHGYSFDFVVYEKNN